MCAMNEDVTTQKGLKWVAVRGLLVTGVCWNPLSYIAQTMSLHSNTDVNLTCQERQNEDCLDVSLEAFQKAAGK